MYNMAAMQFQLKPTNQQRSRRSCDKSRGDNLVSYTRCTYSLTEAMLYITAVQRLWYVFLRKLILPVIIPAVIKN